MKNKTKLLFAGILAAFLMLAVPFAVVSFDADDADATSYTEVGDWGQLKTAIDNPEISAIKFVHNIVYESDTEGEYGLQITRSMEIDGNGYALSRETKSKVNDWKFVNISGIKNGAVTIKGLTIDFAGGGYSRSINVFESQNLTLNIFNTKVSNETHYPVNITPSCTNVNLIINETELNSEGGDIKGYCALNIWGTGHTITIRNSTLVGNNIHPYHEDNFFSTITINSNSSADITIIDSTIKTLSVNDNEQRAVYFSTGSSGSLKISGDSTVDMNAPGYAMIFRNEEINVDLESLTLTTTKNENLIYTESDIKFGSGFETDKLLEVSVCSDVDLIGSPNNSFHGLTVKSYGEGDYDVVIDGINSVGAGIAVFNADVVNIQNCNVCGVNEKLHPYSNNIFGIRVSESNNVTISGNVISDIETKTVGGIKYDGVGIGIYKINESIAINEGNVVSDTGHNSIWIVDSKNASVTIEDNEIFNWAIVDEGRAIRIQNVNSTVISDNLFSKDAVSKNLESTVKVDCDPSKEISVTFNGDILSGNTIFIDDGTTYNSLTVDAGSTYYCYDTTILGSLSAEGDSAFHIAKGGMLSLLFDATINCTINGPDSTRITLSNITAGETGISIVGGSITLHGSIVGGAGSSVVVDSNDITLDGEFSGAKVTVNAGYTVGIGDGLVFGSGTKVVLESGAEFSEDPVFDENSEVTIDGKKTIITEKSKVSSSGVVRAGFYLPIICDNGSVYYRGLEVSSIEVFVGDIYGDYLDELTVKPNTGYVMFRWADDSGMPINDSQTIDEGDKLTAVCAPVPVSSGAGEEESAGFDIADHVVLIEAVIAVLVLIGFVSYIRKN